MFKDSLPSFFFILVDNLYQKSTVYNSNLQTCVSKQTKARISTTPNLISNSHFKDSKAGKLHVFAIVKSMGLLLQSVIKIVSFFGKVHINLMAFVCIFFFWLTDVKCSSVLKVFLNIHAVWA